MTQGFVYIDIDGTELTAEDERWLAHPRTAGVVLFRRNFVNKPQLKALTQAINAIDSSLVISVDQEGGRVQRFRDDFTMLPAMRHWGEYYQDSPERAKQALREYTKIMAEELFDVGIHLSLMPILDVDHGVSWVIGGRSFFSKPEVVIDLARTMIDTMQTLGMPTTGKHFPGHGGVALDSHISLPEDKRTWDELWNDDIKPFAALAGQLDAIMPAHVVYPLLDDKPAGFSSFWLKEVLRERLEFDGVIMSDDLTMAGAAMAGSYTDRSREALNAGCDLLLVCNNRAGAIEVLEADFGEVSAKMQARNARFSGECRVFS